MDDSRTWGGRFGAVLSFGTLGFAISWLVGPHPRACPAADGSATLDLTGLLLVAVATVAIVVDLAALRRGDRFWARIGLVAVSLASVLGIWGAASGFLRPGC
jgi:hypothetical protein